MIRKIKNDSGYSLVELIIVLAIIAVMSGGSVDFFDTDSSCDFIKGVVQSGIVNSAVPDKNTGKRLGNETGKSRWKI